MGLTISESTISLERSEFTILGNWFPLENFYSWRRDPPGMSSFKMMELQNVKKKKKGAWQKDSSGINV